MGLMMDNDDVSSTSTTSIILVEKYKNIDRESAILIKVILRIYGNLSARADLRPCPTVNHLFGELVGLCTKTFSESVSNAVLQDPKIAKILSSLRDICAVSECLLEAHWAEIIANAGDTESVYRSLKAFPYYENYADLTRMELSALRAVNPTPPKTIAFIGSGPLPLTSLYLSQVLNRGSSSWLSFLSSWFPFPFSPSQPQTKVTILNIDYSPLAIAQSQLLCSKLGAKYAKGMQFSCQDAGGLEGGFNLEEFDVVFLAALVGKSQLEKEELLRGVVGRMREGALVVVRGSWGLRRVLYQDFDATTEVVGRFLEICMVVHPYNHVVNSVIIGRVKPNIGLETLHKESIV